MKKQTTPRTTFLASLAAGLAAVGIVLCGNATQAAPVIGSPQLPNAPNGGVGSFATGAYQLQGSAPSANLFTFTVTSTPGVSALTLTLTGTSLPGVITTNLLTPGAGLTATGTTNSETLSTTLSNDMVYTAVIAATDSSGTATTTVTFDTINPVYYTWEMEDFDYNSGHFIDSQATGATLTAGSYDQVDAYGTGGTPGTRLLGVTNVDCHIPGTTNGNSVYRNNPLETEGASDTPRVQYAANSSPDYDVGFSASGNWGNYTRHYPAGLYNVYCRIAVGGSVVTNTATLDLVTSGWGTTNQTTNDVGTFQAPYSRGYQTYYWGPAVSGGSLIALAVGGDQETLRYTYGSGACNENYFMLVPAVPVITPNNTTVYQGNAATLSINPFALSTITALQWQSDNGTGGVTWSNITGATTTSYSLPTNLVAKSYEFQVIATISTNAVAVNVTSGTITLSVQPASAPVVSQSVYPASVTAAVGTITSFSAAFTGPQPITYQWLVSSNLGGTFTTINLQTNTTLLVSNLSVYTNEYELEAFNSLGSNVTTAATLTTFFAPPVPLQMAGDLVVELRSTDLVAGAGQITWTNRSGSVNTVSNFNNGGSTALLVSNNAEGGPPAWNFNNVTALFVSGTGNAIRSALIAPAEITNGATSSSEAWIYAVSPLGGNGSVIAWGIQGGGSFPEQDREMNWGTGGAGCMSGDFGGLDCTWSPTATVGGWFYLAWVWDGTNAIGYINGAQDVHHTLGAGGTYGNGYNGYPLHSVGTTIGVGAAHTTSLTGLGADPFTGWIASARVWSGIMTASQVSNNYNAGLLAPVPVTIFPPTLSPTNTQITVGSNATLTGVFTTNFPLTYTYQWLADNGSGGVTWSNITGATNLSYLINTTGFTPGAYEYELELTNVADSVGAISSEFTINVVAPTPPQVLQNVTPSSITTNVTVTTNITASFTGEAPLTYQWQVSTNNITFTNVPGATTTNISIESDVPLTNWYRLQAVNPLGTNNTSKCEVIFLPPLPFPPYLPLQTAGDLIVNLQQVDLAAGAASDTWSNVTSSANSVGNFNGAVIGGTTLNLDNGASNQLVGYLFNRVNTLFVNDLTVNGLQSTLQAPTEIIGNSPASAEAWIFAVADNQQNSTAIAYGNQAQGAPAQTDREYNYCTSGGGATSGDFGNYDMPWATGTLSTGTWHYLAWTYDGVNNICYEDGVANNTNLPNPNVTPDTFVCVGGAIGQQTSGNPNLAVDSFQGYIGAARLMSGVLTPAQIANNYTAGLLGTVPVTLWAPSVTPTPVGNVVYQGTSVTLGLVDRETTSFTYQWITDGGSGGANWANATGSSTGTNYLLNVSSLTAGTTYQYEIVLTSSTYSLVLTSAPAVLIVSAPAAPTIGAPTPASSNAYVGQTVSFTASVTGTPPITNQWQFSTGGAYSNVLGANSTTLTLNNIQLTNTGSYILTASNAAGSGTPSTPATLTVTVPPAPGISYSGGTLSLTFPAGGTLLEAPTVRGPWTIVSTTSPFLVTPAPGAALFFTVNYGQ